MDFELGEEQRLLRTVARDVLTNEFRLEHVRDAAERPLGCSVELWRKMAQLGWFRVLFPERFGGVGGSFMDLAVLMEQMGYNLLVSPFFPSVVLGGLSILTAGNEELRQKYLPGVGSGEFLLTLAISEPRSIHELDVIETRVRKKGNEHILSGTKILVPYAHMANAILVVAAQNEDPAEVIICLIEAGAPGLKIRLSPSIGDAKCCEVELDNVIVPEANMLRPDTTGRQYIEHVLRIATVAQSAEMVGGIERVLELSVTYSRDRVQFGRSIGSFQAIQHRCADIAIGLDASRYLTYDAAWRISNGMRCVNEASAAKAVTSETYRQATWLAAQIHGGLGFTVKHELPYHYCRAKGKEGTLGDADFHREIIGQQLLSTSQEIMG